MKATRLNSLWFSFSVFGTFLDIYAKLKPTGGYTFQTPVRYSAVKQFAKDYQKTKAQVTTALVTAGCGHWIEKPIEQDQFSV